MKKKNHLTYLISSSVQLTTAEQEICLDVKQIVLLDISIMRFYYC